MLKNNIYIVILRVFVPEESYQGAQDDILGNKK